MNHKGTKQIETDRLILRRFTISDAQDLYRNITSDLNVNKFLTWEIHRDISETRALLKDWEEKYRDPARYCWAVVLKEFGEVIGNISAPTVKERSETVEVTYCLGSRYWGQGIIPEAIKAVMKYLFTEVGVNRIEAGFDSNNPNSGRVMEKAGMIREGLLRQGGRNNQGLFDLVLYGIIKEDFLRLICSDRSL